MCGFSGMGFALRFCRLDFPEYVFWDGIFTAISQKNTLFSARHCDDNVGLKYTLSIIVFG